MLAPSVAFSSLQGEESDVAKRMHDNVSRTLSAALKQPVSISAFRECSTDGRLAFIRVHGMTRVGGAMQKRRLETAYGPGADISADITSHVVTLCVPWPQKPLAPAAYSLGERLLRNALGMVLVACALYLALSTESIFGIDLFKALFGHAASTNGTASEPSTAHASTAAAGNARTRM